MRKLMVLIGGVVFLSLAVPYQVQADEEEAAAAACSAEDIASGACELIQ